MKRRNFLASVAGLFAAPFIARKAAAAPAVKPYTVAVDWVRDSVRSQMHASEVTIFDKAGTTLDIAKGYADFAYAQAKDDILGKP